MSYHIPGSMCVGVTVWFGYKGGPHAKIKFPMCYVTVIYSGTDWYKFQRLEVLNET